MTKATVIKLMINNSNNNKNDNNDNNENTVRVLFKTKEM